MPSSSFAGDISITHEVFIEKGDSPDPLVIVRTHDNGFVMAGTHGIYEAWATRVDAQGEVKWRHVLPVPHDGPRGVSPLYQSAAVMPDDSVFLCGIMTDLSNNMDGYSGLLTHLDKDGNVLSKQTFVPQNTRAYVPQNAKLASFKACMPWGDGLIAVGTSIQPLKALVPSQLPGVGPIKSEPLYWMVAFDGGGKIKWEKLIPMNEDLGADEIAVLNQPLADGGFLFAGTRNTLQTEVVHVMRNGEVAARNAFPRESLTIVQPVDKKDSSVQLASMETEGFTVISLGKDLKEAKRMSEPHERGNVNIVYRLPDQSLVLFGSRRLRGEDYEARVMKLSPDLRHEQRLYFQPANAADWIKAAVPMDTPGDFGTARLAETPYRFDETLEEIEEKEKKGITHKLGVGLATVRVEYSQK